MSNQATKAIVFYHANCMDGFGSAWAFHQWKEKEYNGNVEYIAASYNDDYSELLNLQPNKSDVVVYILDFSFRKEFIWDLSRQFKSIYLYDHHKTAAEELGNWFLEDQPTNVHITIDPNSSGAGLCWFAFSAFHKPCKLIEYIEDRDLWKFSLPHCREITEVIKLATFEFAEYTALAERIVNDFHKVVDIGTNLRKRNEKLIKELADNTRVGRYVTSNKEYYDCMVVNVPGQFASDLGNYLCNTFPIAFAAIYYISGEGKYHYSLRSSKEKGDFDVSKIAKIYGGGGHKNAAGFVTTYAVF